MWHPNCSFRAVFHFLNYFLKNKYQIFGYIWYLIYEILSFFHSKSKLTIMFCWNLFSSDFSGCEILIRNEIFQNLVCHFGFTEIGNFNIMLKFSDQKIPLRSRFTKVLNVRENIWLKGLRPWINQITWPNFGKRSFKVSFLFYNNFSWKFVKYNRKR